MVVLRSHTITHKYRIHTTDAVISSQIVTGVLARSLPTCATRHMHTVGPWPRVNEYIIRILY